MDQIIRNMFDSEYINALVYLDRMNLLPDKEMTETEIIDLYKSQQQTSIPVKRSNTEQHQPAKKLR